jgi:hypothetical protein
MRFKRAIVCTVAASVACALLGAPTAGAATSVGEAFAPTGGFTTCAGSTIFVQAAAPADKFTVPFGGVITSWSYYGTAAVSPIRLKLVHATGVASEFQIVGQSALENTVTPSVLNTFQTRITASPGDTLGIYLDGMAGCGRSGLTSDYIGYHNNLNGDTQPPNAESFNGPFPGVEYDVAANLENDCDSDGFGDETQDTNLSSCAPVTTPGPAPTLPGGTPATCSGVPATIVGTAGSDARTGTQGRDVIAGLGGNDTLSGLAGNDLICGGAGKDTLKGGKGADALLGQKGKDTLKGGVGKDLCKGGKGKDTASKCEVEKSI